jgi:tetratricopeptide (TPR) repeat protein
MREALAVQSYQAALEVITLENDPSEYAMLQNNLGNALQYAASGHPVENNLRALKAYDEALRVRNARLSPLPYANTISNKANCLLNLPDAPGDSGNAQLSNRLNLAQAKTLYLEAREIFREHGEKDKASMIDECLGEIQSQLDLLGPYDGDE